MKGANISPKNWFRRSDPDAESEDQVGLPSVSVVPCNLSLFSDPRRRPCSHSLVDYWSCRQHHHGLRHPRHSVPHERRRGHPVSHPRIHLLVHRRAVIRIHRHQPRIHRRQGLAAHLRRNLQGLWPRAKTRPDAQLGCWNHRRWICGPGVRHDGRSKDRLPPPREAQKSVHRTALWLRRLHLPDLRPVHSLH